MQFIKSFLSSSTSGAATTTTASSVNAETQMFMELVADLARDMENF
jgi:hypothetical protein